MPAPYLGHLSPVLQELSERLMRLQVTQAERALEAEPAPAAPAARAPGLQPFAPVGRTEAEMLKEEFERGKAEREMAAAEMTASILERQQGLAERKQDWEMIKFGVEQETERVKAMAPMTVGLEQAVYLPGEGRFAIPKLTFPEVIDPGAESADIIVVNPNTGQEIGRLNKNLVKKGTVVSDFLDNMWVFDENTGELITKVVNPAAPLKYQLEMEKAKSPVEVALISERAGREVAGIQAASAAHVAGITGKTDIDVALIEASLALQKLLSDESIAMWGITSAEKIAEAKNLIEQGMLVLVEDRLQLDRDALDALNLSKQQERNLERFLTLYKADIVEKLGILGIDVRREELAVTKTAEEAKAEAAIYAVESAADPVTAKWAHEERIERTDIHRFTTESLNTYQQAQTAPEGVQRNDLYEKSLGSDQKINILRTSSLNRLNADDIRATLMGVPYSDRLNALKDGIAKKDMWYKNQLVRIVDLQKKVDGLESEWARAEGDNKTRLRSLVDFARANLTKAQTDATRAATELAQDEATYDQKRDEVLSANDIAWNKAWEKMLRDEPLSGTERGILGMPPKAAFVAETMDEMLELFKNKQEILAEYAPFAPRTWEEQQKVMQYDLTIKAALDLMTKDQKLEFYKKKAEVDLDMAKKKSGIKVEAEKELIDYKRKAERGEYYQVSYKGKTIFVNKETLEEEVTFDLAGDETEGEKLHFYADPKAGVMHAYDSVTGVEVATTRIGKVLGRKEKENLFERLWKSATSSVTAEFGGIFADKDRPYAARIFIGMVEADPSLTPAEKAQYKSWASILGGEEVKLSDMLRGEAMPMVELPGEGITFEEFIEIFNRVTGEAKGGAPVTPVVPVTPTKKTKKKATSADKKRWMDSYWKAHPDATKDEVVAAARKHFGE